MTIYIVWVPIKKVKTPFILPKNSNTHILALVIDAAHMEDKYGLFTIYLL